MTSDINNEDKKTVSVVVCTYNGAEYLEQQLESILSQSILPDEIVIYDDGSSDDTRKIIESTSMDSRVSIRAFFNKVNLGYTKNFENAISSAIGDIIFFSDQDDVWFENKIEVVLQLFSQYGHIAGVTHDGRLVDQNLKWHGTTKRGQIVRGYGVNHPTITGALSAIRKKYLDFFLPIPSDVQGHDTWLTYIFSIMRDRWLYSDLCLQDLRRHQSNTSDWIVNSFEPINKWKVINFQLSSTAAINYNDRKSMNEALTARLCKLDNINALFSEDEVSKAILFLRDELSAIEERQRIVNSSSRISRFFSSFHFWRKGGYRHFNGLKSLARDLIR